MKTDAGALKDRVIYFETLATNTNAEGITHPDKPHELELMVLRRVERGVRAVHDKARLQVNHAFEEACANHGRAQDDASAGAEALELLGKPCRLDGKQAVLQVNRAAGRVESVEALDGSNGIIITETVAEKFFGDEDPIGKSITLDHEHDLTVTALIEDVAANSHFNSQIIMSRPLGILVPMSPMERITEFQPDTNWGNTSMGNLTYVMLPERLDAEWLQTQMDGIYERHVPEDQRRFLAGFAVRPLSEANTAIWDTLGIPVIRVIEGLGIMVLIIACVNYTNLATAQSMGRAREVGLRKTLGAGRSQLLSQFIIESLTITFFAMLLALVVLEAAIPLFNAATGKVLSIDYLTKLPMLLLTVITVG
ncbi:MAG: ABC transporter permease, partial [Proteobacteria bacterium]|nr:ABC transporter permease [Pseudomonadota bacterium]